MRVYAFHLCVLLAHRPTSYINGIMWRPSPAGTRNLVAYVNNKTISKKYMTLSKVLYGLSNHANGHLGFDLE